MIYAILTQTDIIHQGKGYIIHQGKGYIYKYIYIQHPQHTEMSRLLNDSMSMLILQQIFFIIFFECNKIFRISDIIRYRVPNYHTEMLIRVFKIICSGSRTQNYISVRFRSEIIRNIVRHGNCQIRRRHIIHNFINKHSSMLPTSIIKW